MGRAERGSREGGPGRAGSGALREEGDPGSSEGEGVPNVHFYAPEDGVLGERMFCCSSGRYP